MTPRDVLFERLAELERNAAARERLRILGVLRQMLPGADYDAIKTAITTPTGASEATSPGGGNSGVPVAAAAALQQREPIPG